MNRRRFTAHTPICSPPAVISTASCNGVDLSEVRSMASTIPPATMRTPRATARVMDIKGSPFLGVDVRVLSTPIGVLFRSASPFEMNGVRAWRGALRGCFLYRIRRYNARAFERFNIEMLKSFSVRTLQRVSVNESWMPIFVRLEVGYESCFRAHQRWRRQNNERDDGGQCCLPQGAKGHCLRH